MNQVEFKTKKDLEVIGGYDTIDKEYFLYVFDLNVGKIVWSNLTDFDQSDCYGIHRLHNKLISMKIDIPSGFWDMVLSKESKHTKSVWDGTRWASSEFEFSDRYK